MHIYTFYRQLRTVERAFTMKQFVFCQVMLQHELESCATPAAAAPTTLSASTLALHTALRVIYERARTVIKLCKSRREHPPLPGTCSSVASKGAHI